LVTPTLEGIPWLEKPPLYYWATLPFFAVFGISETTARLAPALGALLSALVVAWLGRRLFSPAAGLLAGSILVTSLGFASFGRSASTDMPLTVLLTAGLALLGTGWLGYGRPLLSAAAGGALVGLAVLAKGPVAMVLVVMIGLVFWWLSERAPGLRLGPALLGFFCMMATALPWFWLAFRENGFMFVAAFLINHNLARFVSDIHHHTEPVYYFVPVLAGLFFPWSGWLPVLFRGEKHVLLTARRGWCPSTLFLCLWAVLPFLFFSVSRSKLPGYVLPCLPPLSLLVGNALARTAAGEAAGRRFRESRWLHLALSLAVAAGLPALFYVRYGGRWQIGLPLAAAVLAPVGFSFRAAGRGRLTGVWVGTVLQGFLLLAAVSLFAFPTLGIYHSTRDIARRALELRRPGEPIVTYRFFHHTLNYYTGYRVQADLRDESSLRAFASVQPAFLAVTDSGEDPPGLKEEGVDWQEIAREGKVRLVRVKRSPAD